MTAVLDPPLLLDPDETSDDDQPRCTCGYDGEDELALGPSGDWECADCRATFADQDDCLGGFTFTYAR